jgi:site-specific DNA recombinase
MENNKHEERLVEFSNSIELVSIKKSKPRNCITYTRVSSSKQLTNQSLETQSEAVRKHAEGNGLKVLREFGGIAESAKSDEDRKEFDRMWSFAIKHHNEISVIIVYSLDRFGRSGNGALMKVLQLKEDYGISVVGLTLPTDETVYGDMIKALYLFAAKIENNARTERAVTGMKKRLLKGLWIGMLGIGYEYKEIAGTKQCVINWEGELIRQAFKWKDEGYSNAEIQERLKKNGLDLPRNTLFRVFANVFYTGYIKHGLIPEKVFKGSHTPIVDIELFLRINSKKKRPQAYKKNRFALNSFVKDFETKSSYTGYSTTNRHGKQYSYYKANKVGVRMNRDQNFFERKFMEFLDEYCIKEENVPTIEAILISGFKTYNQDISKIKIEAENRFKKTEEEYKTFLTRYSVNQSISKEDFELVKPDLDQKRRDAKDFLESVKAGLSNPDKFVAYSLELCINMSKMWHLSSIMDRKKLQYLVFPEGIFYDSKTDEYRTPRTNICIELIHRLSVDNGNEKKGAVSQNEVLPQPAVRTGLEPATSCVTGRHSNQLNYRTIMSI